MVNKIQKRIATILICITVKPGLSKMANTPIPTNAKALLSAKENQAAKPPIVPSSGPILLSIKKYVPPAFGIAVESSAFANIEGITRRLARIYETIIAGPTLEKAIPGNTNNPELIIAPEAIQKISRRPSSFFRPLSDFELSNLKLLILW